MNQQNSASPSAFYTLPGVMHYLQTEFTKNERDRINWELERCEMKARIAQLEGENRDLRHELMKLSQAALEGATEDDRESGEDNSFNEPLLLKSKLAVQENVKEIVYLLKSPQVTEQLDAWNNKCSSLHLLETMNLNVRKTAASSSPSGASPLAGEQSAAPTLELSIQQKQGGLNTTHPGSRGYESDQETMILENQLMHMQTPSSSKQRSNSNSLLRRSPSSSLFDVKAAPLKTPHMSNCIAGSASLAYVDKVTLLQNNLLTLSGDGNLKHWLISHTLEANDNLTIPNFHGVGHNVIGIFWWDVKTFITIDETGLNVWSVELPEPVMHWDCFQNLEFENIDVIDFKNKWLVLKLGGRILMWKIDITNEEDNIKMSSNYEIWLDDQDPTFFILGLTEESLIVLYLDPCHLAIYNFQGRILQQVDLSHLTKDLKSRGDNITRLVLNKITSKLLIQINNQIIIYSFDQKKTVANFELDSIPSNIIFKFNSEAIVFGYPEGTIEIRNLSDFKNPIKTYNHYDIEKPLSAKSGNNTSKSNSNSDSGEDDPPMKNFMSIDIAVIEGLPTLVSGGDNGLIRLESIWEVAC